MVALLYGLTPRWFCFMRLPLFDIPLYELPLIVIQLSSGLLKACTPPGTKVQRSIYTCAWEIPRLDFLGSLGQVSLCVTRTLAMESQSQNLVQNLCELRYWIRWHTFKSLCTSPQGTSSKKIIQQDRNSQTRMAVPPQESHKHGVFVTRSWYFFMFNEINDLY